jgi:hypothetical protein
MSYPNSGYIPSVVWKHRVKSLNRRQAVWPDLGSVFVTSNYRPQDKIAVCPTTMFCALIMDC